MRFHSDTARVNIDIPKMFLEFDAGDCSVQSLVPPNRWQRFEGIAFSPTGNVIGVATSDTNAVLLFRKDGDGEFEHEPYLTIEGPNSRLSYPHDLSFSRQGAGTLLAVAQRIGAISIYETSRDGITYGKEPVFEISGQKTKLDFSDGVAFVPPDSQYLAACNLQTNRISFYRKNSGVVPAFHVEPAFVLEHSSLADPDGLAFSHCGRWLAVANHGNHTVSVFQRGTTLLGKLKYGPKPLTVIQDESLRHPHSVAFTPLNNCLVVTNSGANYFSIYPSVRDGSNLRWSQTPALRKTVGPESRFQEVNARNKMEGGPKGIAIHENQLALCSPEHGVKIYSFREQPSAI
jgi:DNA-binding beta-propeller fold protein YncE